MDLPLYFRTLRRHWIVVTLGICLALALAIASYIRPSYEDGKLVWKYRTVETWQSEARVLLSVPGFPVGSASLSPGRRANAIEQAGAQLPSLAVLYAGIATGDDVRAIVQRAGPIRGKAVAAAATAAGGTATLPIVEVTALAPSAAGSRGLADRFAYGLMEYIQDQQSDRPAQEQVALSLLSRGGQTELVRPRSRTLPVIVFLAILSATVGVAFALENMKTRRAPSIEVEPPSQREGHAIEVEPPSHREGQAVAAAPAPAATPASAPTAAPAPSSAAKDAAAPGIGLGGGRTHQQVTGPEPKRRLAQ